MKYVMFRCVMGVDLEVRTPIMFPDGLSHSDVALVMSSMLRVQYKYSRVTPVSAGFIDLGMGVRVHGGSDTLGLEHDPADGQIISTYELTQGLDL